MSKKIKTFCDGEVSLEELQGETCPELCDEKDCPFYQYYFSESNTLKNDVDEIQGDDPNYAKIEVVFKRESTGEIIDLDGTLIKPQTAEATEPVQAVEEPAPKEASVSVAEDTSEQEKAKPKVIGQKSSRLSRIEKFRARFQKRKEEEDTTKDKKDPERGSKKSSDKSSKVETSELSDALKALGEKFGKS